MKIQSAGVSFFTSSAKYGSSQQLYESSASSELIYAWIERKRKENGREEKKQRKVDVKDRVGNFVARRSIGMSSRN